MLMRFWARGMAIAIAILAITMPQYTQAWPNMNMVREGDEATPRATKPDMSSPMNMRRYTFFITSLTCCVSVRVPP